MTNKCEKELMYKAYKAIDFLSELVIVFAASFLIVLLISLSLVGFWGLQPLQKMLGLGVITGSILSLGCWAFIWILKEEWKDFFEMAPYERENLFSPRANAIKQHYASDPTWTVFRIEKIRMNTLEHFVYLVTFRTRKYPYNYKMETILVNKNKYVWAVKKVK